MTELVGVLDCGSNSTRLLIAARDRSIARRETRITRLSQGVDATRTLTEDAMGRSFAVIDEYRARMDEFGVVRGLLVATSAVRDAANGQAFLDEAARRSRVPARILSGGEEAQFSYAGATVGLESGADPALVVDVGGGSTELAVMRDGVLHSVSMQLGCVRVTERALGRDVVTPERDAAARAMIAAELDKAFVEEPVFSDLVGHVRLVGVAGTVSTLAQLDGAVTAYDRGAIHHRRLSRESVRRWRDVLSAEPPSARLAHPGMVVGREDVMAAGLYVLDAVMERFGVEELLSSEDDILDGVAVSLFAARA